MLKSYTEFITEKDMKAEKAFIEEKIMNLFKEKPAIGDSKGIYNLSNIIKYVGLNSTKVAQVFHDMQKDSKIKQVSIRNEKHNQSYPYYYIDEYTSKDEIDACKETIEKKNQEIKKATVKKVVKEPERKVVKEPIKAKKTGVRVTSRKPITKK